MSKKKMAIANFNLVFYGENGKEEVLLDYFDSIVYPAFAANEIRKAGDSSFLVMDVKVIEDDEGDFILKGKLVKKTILEVKSDIDENGELVKKDDKYPSAPYSMFAIFLRNHRMIYVENQKGSPNLANFSSMSRFLLNKQMRKLNVERKKRGMSELPAAVLNIIGIPQMGALESVLESVDKIDRLILKFMPLNGDGDVDFSGMFNNMSTELRKEVGAMRGEVSLPSPKNKKGIINVITKAQGTIEPVFKVTYPNKVKGTIKNNTISENMHIDISGENVQEHELEIIKKGKENKSVSFVSESNDKIYNENRGKIIPFVKK